MRREELRQLVRGPVATVPTAMDDRYRLDLGLMAELTRWWVDSRLVRGTTVNRVRHLVKIPVLLLRAQ